MQHSDRYHFFKLQEKKVSQLLFNYTMPNERQYPHIIEDKRLKNSQSNNNYVEKQKKEKTNQELK